MQRIWAVLLFMALLAPSGWFAWRNRHMPQFGEKHDDAIYYIVAKSVAESTGYRILSLPGEPFETKYPPVLPMLLTIPWLLNPGFPENLVIATALQWAVIPPFLFLSLIWFRRAGLSVPQRWIAVALLAISPYTVLFGAGIYTEILFCLFLLGSLLACEEARRRQNGSIWAAIAGLLAGLAFLTRTAGLAAAISGLIVFSVWRKRREALAFAAGAFPSLAGWIIWSRWHQSQSLDVASLYNTNYLGFALLEVRFSDILTIIPQNISYLCYHAGLFLFPLELDSLPWHLVMYATAAATIAGVVRHCKNPNVLPYTVFGLITSAELIVWDWPPNFRLLYALGPLFAVGFMWEGEHFLKLLRNSLASTPASSRRPAWVIGFAATVLVITGGWMQFYMNVYTLPNMISTSEGLRSTNLSVYDWISHNVSVDKSVVAQNPSLYLYTGKKTFALASLPIYWYRQDVSRMLAPFGSISAGRSEYTASYVYLRESDYAGMVPGYAAEASRVVRADSGLIAVFRDGDGTVFTVKPDAERGGIRRPAHDTQTFGRTRISPPSRSKLNEDQPVPATLRSPRSIARNSWM